MAENFMHGMSGGPEWLRGLLGAKFFVNCETHSIHKKNERNVYCMDCFESICQHCLGKHADHRLLQVRRYVYNDVVRLQEMMKLFDCSGVQTYVINSARAVFLNQRPQSRSSKGHTKLCETCARGLADIHRYCSLCCKVVAHLKKGLDLGPLLGRSSSLPLDTRAISNTTNLKRTFSEVEMREDSKEDNEPMSQTTSGSSADSLLNDGDGFNSLSEYFATPKRSRNRPVFQYSQQTSPKSVLLPFISRRKGNPQRAPPF